MSGFCDYHNQQLDTHGKCWRCQSGNDKEKAKVDDYDPLQATADAAHAEWVLSNLEEKLEQLQEMLPRVSYIATYSAECDGGHVVTANLAMQSVLEGTTPGALIELITEQAFSDMARSGNNAVRVVVLNLSRVW